MELSVNNSQKEQDFSKYDSMSTEQLQEILRLDAEMLESSVLDTDELFYIMEVLTTRRKSDPNYAEKTTQQAYETFKKHYMPSDSEEEIGAQISKPIKSNKRIPWLRRLSAAAAVLAVLILATISANAFGYDLWGKIAVWSDDFFWFVDDAQGTTPSESSKPDGMEYTSLQQALDEYKITQALAPTWLPDGYILSEIIVERTPMEISFYALCEASDDSSLTISIRQVLSGIPEKVEKSEGFVEIYESSGVAYHLFSNYEKRKASWVVAEFECYISGNISLEELKAIIDSIH